MKNKLSYELIEKAVSGDVEAINRIVEIYEPYINTLASQTLLDSDGNEYVGVNDDLKEHLTSKLLDVISKYRVDVKEILLAHKQKQEEYRKKFKRSYNKECE